MEAIAVAVDRRIVFRIIFVASCLHLFLFRSVLLIEKKSKNGMAFEKMER